MNSRQIIIIFGILVGLLAIGFVIAWYSLSTMQNGEGATAEPGYFDFLGFGGEITTNTPPAEEENVEIIKPSTGKTPLLRKLTDVPVSGAVATTTKDGLLVRYIERGTGHVYDVDLSTGIKARLSQTTIPRVQEAFWMTNALRVVIRYFDSEYEFAETFAGLLTKDTRAATGTPSFALDGVFLEQDIRSITLSASDQRIAYTTKNTSGSSLFTVKSDGTGKVQIYTSPVREWLLQWFKNDTIALTTKPSSATPGFLYFIPSKGGQPERILPGTFGLTTLVSPQGDRVLFSEATGNGLALKAFVRKDRVEVSIPTATLPEKCVWSRNEAAIAFCGVPQSIEGKEYPDVWYMGLTSFNDQIWKIDTTIGAATLLAIPKEYTTEEIDAVNLSLTKNEDYLIFTNKKDGALWALELE